MIRTRSIAICSAVLLGLALSSPRGAAAYLRSDLQGTWEFSAIASGPGAPWWERARASIAADGSFTAVSNDHLGGTDNIAGELDLTSMGIVTQVESSTFRGVLDSGKTLLAWTDTWTSDAPGTTELRLGVKLAPTYALSDLAGDWEMNIIASGPAAPWWQRGRITSQANGTFVGSLSENGSAPEPVAGSFGLTTGGILTFSGSASARGAMDAHKTVVLMTSTWTGFEAGTVDLAVGVKMAASYTLADLVGTWEVHALATGPGAPHWTRSHLSVLPDGSFVRSALESNGAFGSSTGTLAITPAGVITRAGGGDARGVLDAGKTAMVWTSTWTSPQPGTTEIEIALKTNPTTAGVVPGPSPGLALEPIRPNPMRGGALTVHFILPTSEPAQLELVDLSGRRVAGREISALGIGRHAVDLSGQRPLAPGLYFVNLTQGSDHRMARVVVLH